MSVNSLLNKERISRKIDHIVYAVQNLDAAIDEFEKKLGVRAIFGGFHKSFGTKNALISLDNGCYLELLAADDTNTKVSKPRWMGIDLLQKNQLTRWAIKSNQLQTDSAILKKVNPQMGSIRSGSRNLKTGGLLQWELIMPLPEPEVELLPFMIDWSASSVHPSEELPPMGCKLKGIFGTHPTPDKFKTIFEELGVELNISTASKIQLTTLIECPNGQIEI